eukprot:scaffold4595_cov191-Alexandrium_tamarense.AAC.5
MTTSGVSNTTAPPRQSQGHIGLSTDHPTLSNEKATRLRATPDEGERLKAGGILLPFAANSTVLFIVYFVDSFLVCLLGLPSSYSSHPSHCCTPTAKQVRFERANARGLKLDAEDRERKTPPNWQQTTGYHSGKDCPIWLSPNLKLKFTTKQTAFEFEEIVQLHNRNEKLALLFYLKMKRDLKERPMILDLPRDRDCSHGTAGLVEATFELYKRISLAARNTIAHRKPGDGWKFVQRVHNEGVWISPGWAANFKSMTEALEFEEIREAHGFNEEMANLVWWKKESRQSNVSAVERDTDAKQCGKRKARDDEVSNNDDECYFCRDGGNLLCCDYCSKSFHLRCHKPPLNIEPAETIWKCCECKTEEEPKKQRKEYENKSKSTLWTVQSSNRFVFLSTIQQTLAVCHDLDKMPIILTHAGWAERKVGKQQSIVYESPTRGIKFTSSDAAVEFDALRQKHGEDEIQAWEAYSISMQESGLKRPVIGSKQYDDCSSTSSPRKQTTRTRQKRRKSIGDDTSIEQMSKEDKSRSACDSSVDSSSHRNDDTCRDPFCDGGGGDGE